MRRRGNLSAFLLKGIKGYCFLFEFLNRRFERNSVDVQLYGDEFVPVCGSEKFQFQMLGHGQVGIELFPFSV